MPTFWVLALFGDFYNFGFQVQTCRHLGGGGGVCVYFLKSARKCHFRNVWVVHPFLFRITVIVSIPFFGQGWNPIRADIPLFVDRDMFLSFQIYPTYPYLRNTQWAQMRQQWHRPPKTQKVGIISNVPERYGECSCSGDATLWDPSDP